MISRNVPKQNKMSGLFTFSVKVSTSLLAPCPSYACIFHGQGEAVTSKGSRSWRLTSPDQPLGCANKPQAEPQTSPRGRACQMQSNLLLNLVKWSLLCEDAFFPDDATASPSSELSA